MGSRDVEDKVSSEFPLLLRLLSLSSITDLFFPELVCLFLQGIFWDCRGGAIASLLNNNNSV